MDIAGLVARWGHCLSLLVWTLLVLTPGEVSGNLWRKSLEKELLQYSVRYLREQLLVCVKASDNSRGKRRAEPDYWLKDMELQMDIDILQNSLSFLMERVTQCRKALARESHAYPLRNTGPLFPDKLSQPPPHPGSLNPAYNRHLPGPVHNNPAGHLVDDQVAPVNNLPSADRPRMAGYHAGDEYLSPHSMAEDTQDADQRQDTLTADDTHLANEGYQPKSPAVTSWPEIVGFRDSITTPTRLTRPTTTTTTTTTPVPTTRPPKVEFVIGGRRVTCDSVNVTGPVFVCWNLRVGGTLRLPNMDYCPPNYDPSRWRHVTEMATRTKDVLDLRGLCAVIGLQMKVPGFAKDVRVVWGCDDTQTRLTWKDNQWVGPVEDNGYLHDLQCLYSADI